MLFRRAVMLLAPLVAALPFTCLSAPAQQRAERHVLLISDIHFNPYPDDRQCDQPDIRRRMDALAARPGETWTPADFNFQSGYAHYGDDSNWPLLHSALVAAHAALPHPAVIIVSGDWIVHNPDGMFAECLGDGPQSNAAAYTAFLGNIIRFELTQLEHTFPGVPIVSALGNNDTDTGDYKLPSDAMLAAIAPAFARALNGGADPNFNTTFATGGYYSSALHHFDDAEVLVLNTNALTPKAQSSDAKRSGPAARAQMEWLSSELNAAREHHRNVIVVGHVPPGLDAYASHHAHQIEMMFAEQPVNYARQVPALLNAHASQVRMGIFGHTHMDDFRVTGSAGVPIEIVPSVSPIVGNNPAFVVLDTTASFRPLDHMAHYIPLAAATPAWTFEYDFRKLYGEPDYSAASLAALTQRLRNDLPLRHIFYTEFNSNSNGAQVPDKWQPAYLCALDNLTAEAVAPCLLEALGMPFAP